MPGQTVHLYVTTPPCMLGRTESCCHLPNDGSDEFRRPQKTKFFSFENHRVTLFEYSIYANIFAYMTLLFYNCRTTITYD